MHFIDKQDGAAAGLLQYGFSTRDGFADFLDARQHRRNGNELCIKRLRHQPRQRCFADTRRPPEDHRMRFAGLKCKTQGLSRTEQMLLANDFIQCARPQTLRQRRIRLPLGEQIAHRRCTPRIQKSRPRLWAA